MDAEQTAKPAQIARIVRNKDGRQVYFLEAIGTGLVKIGYANNVSRRIAGFQTGSAVPLKLIAVVPGDHKKEQEIHAILAPFRCHGEWFARCPLMDELIAANANTLKEARLLKFKDNYLFAYVQENFTRKPTVEAGLDAVKLV